MTDETPPSLPIGPTPEQLERNEKMSPLLTVVTSEAFASVMADLAALSPQYADEPLGFAHVHAAASVMPRLKAWVEGEVTPS